MSISKGQALYNFFSQFGIQAYPVTSVPDNIAYPWLTYEAVFDDWFGGSQSISVNLWYHTESEAIPNAKAEEIGKAIGAGAYAPYDGGAILITKGSPFINCITDASDMTVKGRTLNVNLEYLTI